MNAERVEELKNKFAKLYGHSPKAIVKGPGRVDLMGSHTDYNDGFVLPVAVNHEVLAAGSLRDDDIISVYSANFNNGVEFSLKNIEYDKSHTWSNYVRGVVHFLQEEGIKLQGANIALHGNVPIGSGMSSSAAIEMAVGFLLQTLIGFEMSGPQLALIGQKAEKQVCRRKHGHNGPVYIPARKERHCIVPGLPHAGIRAPAAGYFIGQNRSLRYDEKARACGQRI